MRTKDDIIKSFLAWLAEKHQDDSYNTYLDVEDDEELVMRKSSVWSDLLKLCYQETHGFFYFMKFILGDLTYAGYPEPIRYNKLWLKWTKLIKTSDHLCIECPRQHSKTTFFTVVYPLYRLSLFLNYNVAIISASEEQAIMILGYMANIIETNEFLLSKKSKKAKWSATEISYNGGVVRAKGVGSEIRGGTYDLVICDDVLRSDNKLSDADIENFVKEEVEATILVRKGQLIIVGTPRNSTDIFANVEDMIEEDPECGWVFKRYQAILDYDKQLVLCPDRFTFEQLMQKRKIVGQLKFDKEFMCMPYSSGSQLFPDALIQSATDKGKDWETYDNEKPEESYYIGVDVARSGSASADATVIIVMALNEDTQEKRLVNLYRRKGMKIKNQARLIAHISEQFGHPPIMVEKNNIGQDMIDELMDTYNVNVEAFLTTSVSKKYDLIRNLIVAFENEKIIIPQKTEQDKQTMLPLINELKNFVIEITKAGNEIMKGSGKKKDDTVMALSITNKCTQKLGARPFAQGIPRKKYDTDLEAYAVNGTIEDILKLSF